MAISTGNRGVVYTGPGEVEVRSIAFPELSIGKRQCQHGVILKVLTTNICGSDQHMVRGRTTAPSGLVLGHEITGEIIECGRDVEFLKVGDIVSVPFNIACGRCRNCKEGRTGICLNVNPARPGAATAMLIWEDGLAVRPSMSWCRTLTLIYSNSLTQTKHGKKFVI
ncbi:Glutathione-independent formaldehyde dehydrogenase [Nitrincola nitratireducens]|uniref:Glutathione-independent formaldehyde dehydrogenase n=1 Tax=Nitrincola nitratireducens TaxID=1229521 RepID=W9VRS8_9GAMM|nr:Glutathione-independent formaldehyde dehydrogenase [Nitrincola nitratireducens]